jgi:hypothetical protein
MVYFAPGENAYCELRDNVKGLMPGLMRNAGFVEVHESVCYLTVFGTISRYAVWKPN